MSSWNLTHLEIILKCYIMLSCYWFSFLVSKDFPMIYFEDFLPFWCWLCPISSTIEAQETNMENKYCRVKKGMVKNILANSTKGGRFFTEKIWTKNTGNWIKILFRTLVFFAIFGLGDPSCLWSWSVAGFKLKSSCHQTSVRGPVSNRICFMTRRSFFIFSH